MRALLLKNKIPVFMGLLVWLIQGCFAQKMPDWGRNRPIVKDYYIGIGIGNKSSENRDYIQVAKDNALKDLAAQITVKISSEVISQVVEKSGMVEEAFWSQIRSSTQADLEGFEMVDTWESPKEYWVYYRLSKALYQRQKMEKLEKAASLSLDFFSKADENEQNNNIDKALMFYLQAIPPLEKYLAEPLEVEYKGMNIYLMNEIYSSLQNLISQIELRPAPKNVSGQVGKPLPKPLMLDAVFNGKRGEASIANLPLEFYFSKGSGELVGKVRANRNGEARCLVSKISSAEKMQLINARLDYSSYVPEDGSSIILLGIVKSLPVPETKYILDISGLTVYMETHEVHLGHLLKVPHLEPALKRSLTDQGFTFKDSKEDVDFAIKIEAESRKGTEVYGMYSAYVNLTVSVVDMKSGLEVYKNSLNDVKGIDLTYEKGGLKAFNNAAKEIGNKMVPDLITQIQK